MENIASNIPPPHIVGMAGGMKMSVVPYDPMKARAKRLRQSVLVAAMLVAIALLLVRLCSLAAEVVREVSGLVSKILF